MPRFFVPRAELGENFLVLTGENAAHARVLRLKNGDAVTVCDGEGEEWHCVVSDVAPGQVSLVVQEHTAAKSEAAVFCSVYMAFAKADKFEHVIQKATELGAAELVAFPSARCVSSSAGSSSSPPSCCSLTSSAFWGKILSFPHAR